MTAKIVQSYSQNLLVRLGLGLAAFVVLCGCCSALSLVYSLVPPDLAPAVTPFFAIGQIILCSVGFIGAVGLIVFLISRGNFKRLDEAFGPLGLTGSRYLLTGRQYQGSYRGRQVSVQYYISGGRYLRTSNLVIYLGGNFGTRLGIGTKTVLSQLGGAFFRDTEIALTDPAYEGLLAYGPDENWARTLLNESHARELVVRLAGKDTPGVRGLGVTPISVRLHLRHFQFNLITPETVRQWLDDLVTLAEVAERLPQPVQRLEATEWDNPTRPNQLKIFAIAIAIFVVPLACLFLIIVTAMAFIMMAEQAR